MKILVKLFLIILVIFSFSQASSKLLVDKIADAEISSFTQRAARYKSFIKRYPYWGNYWKKQVTSYEGQAASYKKMQKDDRDKLYKIIVNITKTKKSHLENNLKWINRYIKQFKDNSRIVKSLKNYKNRTKKEIEAYNKTIKQLKEEHEKENSKFSSKFDAWQKKDKINPTTTTLKKDKEKKSKLKVSSAKKGKTTLSSSNLKTTVKTSNINVSGKASVGAVSIGKNEKK